MRRPQFKVGLKAMAPLLVLALSVGALSACSDSSSDTASTEPAVEEAPTPTEATVDEEATPTEAAVDEAPTPTAVEEPGALTAETTGNVSEGSVELSVGIGGEFRLYFVEVTMDDGSVRSFPTDEETVKLIWPDGTTTAGVRVVIEEVDGEQQITGPAK